MNQPVLRRVVEAVMNHQHVEHSECHGHHHHALAPATTAVHAEAAQETPAATQWTCPMHPEILRDGPGSCPICGMALEPKTVTAEETADPELASMTKRFWIAAALSVPLVVLVMADMLASSPLLAPRTRVLVE